VSVDTGAVEQRVATFAKSAGITDIAGWQTFIAARFNGTNASGLSANTRSLMVEFFDNLVRFDP
jgi:hypothetical protein